MENRVVITGIGVISSIGIGRKNFWEALNKGTSGISRIASFDTSDFPTHNGGEVKDFFPEDYLDKRKTRFIGRTSMLAMSAARLALKDSALNLSSFNRERSGVCMGTTMGETQVLEEINHAWVKQGEKYIDAKLISRYPSYVLASNLGADLKLKGPNYIIPTACAAGNYAIGYASDLIKSGDADIMFAGGADAFSKIAFVGFNRLYAVAPDKCQPFDKNRKGMMVGEGAGVVVLEKLESALKRKAEIYAEILDYSLSCDAHHMTAPESNGIAACLQKALSACGLTPEDVDYLNAHGTGTPANDREECLAIKKVFGERAVKLPVSSIKSMLGHTMGAASSIEAIACALAVKNDLIPPTINFETPDPECDIDCVPNTCRRQKTDIAFNSSSAFGGNNACLVIKKYI